MSAALRLQPWLVAAAFACLGWQTLFDHDLGLQLANGRWMMEHGTVPATNVFSPVFADRPWVNDKWLFHLLSHALIDGIGPLAAKLARCALLFGLGFVVGLTRGASAPLLAMAALLGAHERFGFRPELFTLLFVAWFVRELTRPAALGTRALATLAAMQVLWANLHGFWIVGPILAAAAAVGAFADARMRGEPARPAAQRALLAPVLLLLAFANPYGFALVRSPVDILLDLRANHDVYAATITEFVSPWASFDVLPYDLVAYRALAIASLVALVLARRRVRAVEALPLVALFAMSLAIRRNAAPFCVAAAIVLPAWLARVAAFETSVVLRRATRAAAFALAAWIGWAHVSDHLYVHDGLDRSFFEANEPRLSARVESAWIRDRLPPGALFNSFSFGSTFTGVAFPERQAFIDGNTAGYPASFLREYAEFVNARGDAQAFVARYGFEQCLVKPGHPVLADLLRLGFVPVFGHAQAVVLVKQEPKYVPAIAAVDPARDLLAGEPGIAGRADLGLALWRAGHPADALRVLDAALADGEGHVLQFRRALALSALGRMEEAKTAARRALELQPGFEPATEFLARNG